MAYVARKEEDLKTPIRPLLPPGATPLPPGAPAPAKPTLPAPAAPKGGYITSYMPGEPEPGEPPAPPEPAPAPAPEPAAPPAPPAGPLPTPPTEPSSGDPYIDEVRASGKTKSEDYARFSDDDLRAWKQYYIGGGKFRNIYGDVVDKPDERGPNTPHNRNGTGDQGDFGWGWNDSGVGGEAPSGGGAGGGGFVAPGEMAGASDTIWQAILARLQGGTRYTPEALQSIMGALKNQAEAQAEVQTEQSNADLAARGLARSSIGAAAQQRIRAGVGQNMQQAQAGMMKAKIDADFQDKSEAIKEGLDWLNSLRDYTARMAATAAQREAAMANINLGYAQLRQQMDYLREQYAQQLALYGLTV